ncbi:hypothetical protein CONPUDRAFT_165754 [Coniophora puteana RWD-64-598 SS2]|uniref:F-box domain-containing protein n=1 Tax=Coniophora puteana (strain RWD-64-598) TaxID=741705 RepID=A0A5M3MM99_CONPW|nr:uncharacterized protein CONPUDRAFT_165754 [Coniophora puteana RWD-64-598 SS2]EIW80157.1 hypothetical protein CONPUDRAFT_165754 [Coniophora puteana RWD-64-598 SS2]
MSGRNLALPDELLVATFLDLNIASITACRQTCKRFQQIIEDSVHVQYHVELQLACMKNGPNSDMSTASRHSMLRARRRAWEALSWSTPEPVLLPTPPGVTKWKLVGGILCVAGSGFIQCICLPSLIRGIEQREWRIDHTCGEGGLNWDFCHDPSQDLLVLFGEFKLSDEEESHSAFRVHLLTLSTGAPHPAATSSVLLYAPEFRYWDLSVRLTLQVCGQHFGMVMEDHDCKERPKFAVWNCVSGLKEMEIDDCSLSILNSFLLLPDDLLLLGVESYSQEGPDEVIETYIGVYDLERTAQSVPYTLDNEDDQSCIFKLRFPPKFAGGGVFITSTPLSADKHVTGNGSVECASPFVFASEAQLIVVYLNIHWSGVATRVFFPAAIIAKHVCSVRGSGALGVDIPWSEWGRSSRVTMDTFRTKGGYGRNEWYRDSTLGLRFAAVLDHILSQEEWMRLELYGLVAVKDFNPMAHAARSNLGEAWTRPQPETKHWEARFRVAWRKVDGSSRWWDSCLLDEDAIVLVSEDRSGGPLFAVMSLKEPREEPTGGV